MATQETDKATIGTAVREAVQKHLYLPLVNDHAGIEELRTYFAIPENPSPEEITAWEKKWVTLMTVVAAMAAAQPDLLETLEKAAFKLFLAGHIEALADKIKAQTPPETPEVTV